MEILFIFLLAAAVRGLVQQTKRDLDKWKKRPPKPRGPGVLSQVRGALSRVTAGGTGYWGHQAAHGFPSARHGMVAGWHRGVQAHQEAKSRSANAAAETAEHRARTQPEIDAARQRRQQALENLERQQAAQEQAVREEWELAGREREPGEPEDPPEDDPGPGKPDEPGPDSEPVKPEQGENGNLVPPKWPGQDEEPAQSEYEQEAQTIRNGFQYENCEVCGRDLEEHRIAPDVLGHAHAYCLDDSEPGQERPGQQDPGGTGKGEAVTNSSGETTYAGVKARMTAAIAAAEQRQAEAAAAAAACDARVEEVQQAKVWAQNTADQMQALEVDGATLGAMAEHLEALDKVVLDEIELQEVANRVKADWDRVVESAQNVCAQLDASGHGAVQEARDNAAAGGGKKEFYEGN